MNSDPLEKHWEEDPGGSLPPTAPLMGWDSEGRDLLEFCPRCKTNVASLAPNGVCWDCDRHDPDGGQIKPSDHAP